MTKKKKTKNRQLKNKVIGIFSNNPTKSFNYKQIAQLLQIKNTSKRKEVIPVLEDIKEQGLIAEINRGKYTLKSREGTVTGKVIIVNSRSAVVQSDKVNDDIIVPFSKSICVLLNDIVQVQVFPGSKKGSLEGKVTEVIERAPKKYVGILKLSDHHAFLIPDSKKMPFDLYIPFSKLNNGKDGDKAIARLTEWPSNKKNPYGEIIEVLGKQGDHEAEMHSIMAEYNFPFRFPEDVLNEAEKITTGITKEEIKKRRDFRDKLTFTIDPKEAKDFDDALSIEQISENKLEISIHIADVAHYIKPGSLIDQEAHDRGTSVYLVDRVIPMLPERLSNDICSLRPDEEKLCFSAVFVLDKKGVVSKRWFGRTVIKSDRRFNYKEIQDIINTRKSDYSNEILLLNQIAQELRKQRFKNGSIDFERFEVHFEIDEKGVPLEINLEESNEAHQLIEEFMLLANKEVAKTYTNDKQYKKDDKPSKKGFVYRIHDHPDPDKIKNFIRIVRRFGYQFDTQDQQITPTSLNQLLKNIKSTNEQNLIETLLLRSMSKAVYSPENIGHYGLAFEYYTHFTSPIRRYPDVMVHRLLEDHLEQKNDYKTSNLNETCKHVSAREQLAVDAERASIKYKQVEFMSDKIGDIYTGIISGVSQMGLFIELIANKCEGLVPMNDLDDDYYVYDEKHYLLKGRKTKTVYQLGDKVNVQVTRADIPKKQLDLHLLDKI